MAKLSCGKGGKKKCGWLFGRQRPLPGIASCGQSKKREPRENGQREDHESNSQICNRKGCGLKSIKCWWLQQQFGLETDIVVFGRSLKCPFVEPPNEPDWD